MPTISVWQKYFLKSNSRYLRDASNFRVLDAFYTGIKLQLLYQDHNLSPQKNLTVSFHYLLPFYFYQQLRWVINCSTKGFEYYGSYSMRTSKLPSPAGWDDILEQEDSSPPLCVLYWQPHAGVTDGVYFARSCHFRHGPAAPRLPPHLQTPRGGLHGHHLCPDIDKKNHLTL